jgi:transcriptional antiterminator NusG
MTDETGTNQDVAAKPEGGAKQWFVVHTYSGFENKVAAAIEQRAKIFGLQDLISRVVVPVEEVVEVRKGQKRISSQKFYPGYVLVEMELTDETWHLVRTTPKVTGFVGSGSRPVPLPTEEVEEILRQMEEGAEKPKPKAVFSRGDKVRVIEGPFVNFTGTIEDVNPERGRLKVMVGLLGRLTPVELEYYQVERL